MAKKDRVPVKEQDPLERIKNFNEVSLGYSKKEAEMEARRCLQCKGKPCVKGCPVGIDVPAFVKMTGEGRFDLAIGKIREANPCPKITGRVCPQENQCEKECTLGKVGEPLAIGKLERFVADLERDGGRENANREEAGKKAAIVGSGPAGLMCAAELGKMGYSVTVFEALHEAGGVLTYGIPEFRLPKKVVKDEVERIKKLGVKLELDIVVGRTITIPELLGDFDAVFIGSGAGLPSFMGIPGENLNGTYSANEFLTRVNLMHANLEDFDTPIQIGKTVATIGAGNVAIDCARVALRLGAEKSYIIYRRSEEEAPARKEEIQHAKEEGVEFMFLTLPTSYIGDKNGDVSEIMCIKTKLEEPDSSGRRRAREIHGSEFSLKADTVIVAIGQRPNPLIPRTTPDMKTSRRGTIEVDDSDMTSIPGVFAGGDITTGAATVILAMQAGKKAAKAINEYLNKQKA
jgi:glutamate synthase (NADPH/NADH) small chain